MSLNTILATTPNTTSGYVLRATGTTIGNSTIQDDGTNVAIGTTPGTYKLNVSGTGNFTGALTGTSGTFSGNLTINSSSLLRLGNSDNASTMQIWNSQSGAANNLLVYDNAASAYRFVINSSGTLLVNATSSTYGAASGYNLGVKGTSGQAFISIARTGQSLDSQGMILGLDTAAGQLTMIDNLPLTFATNNAERMRITNGGNVGIGTTSPTYLLQINSSTTAAHLHLTNSTTGSTSNDGTRLFAAGLDTYLANREAGAIIFETSDTERMRITSGGQLLFSRTTSSSTDCINIETYSGFSGRGILLNMDAGNDAITIGGAGSQNAINVTNSSKKVIISNLGGSGTVTVQADNSGTLIKSSDSSLKQEDKEYKIQGLAEILQLQPRAYKWLKDIEIRKEEAVTEIGFFADEVNPIIPSAAPKGFDGLYGFNDRAVTAALVKAIQELNQTVQNQQQQINSLINR